MNYWWVNHKQTYQAEVGGGLIWSPIKNKNSSTNKSYTNQPKPNFAVIFWFTLVAIKKPFILFVSFIFHNSNPINSEDFHDIIA